MSSIQKLPRWFYIGLAFPLVFLNAWFLLLLYQYLQPIPGIVLTASLIAFLLEYPILFLEQRGVPRGFAITGVMLLALFLLGILVFVLSPLVLQQLIEFVNRLPAWIEEGRKQLETLDEKTILQYLPMDISDLTTQITSQLSRAIKSLSAEIIDLTLNTINSALNLIVTVVLTFLLVLNGEKLWNGILSWLPSEWNSQIQLTVQQTFRGYYAGQAILALIFSIALSVAFLILKIPFWLLFGFGIGLSSLIPFGGTFTLIVISTLLTLHNVFLGVKVLITALIIGQINENVVAPRLIGGITGLNPALVIVSLLAGVKIAGVLGLLLAVPTASIIKKTADNFRSSGEIEKSHSL
ncbi:MAG: AI-2E family transporter [Limnoraphis sp. WC205]|jgi:predicted PurR-regulated permease PerM|nr:AI-2E family transporter [Limnoraphis sp. WC205]